jgi:hypothetical protein
VFEAKNGHIHVDDAMQVGFQTTAFAGVVETPGLLTGSVMTESGMKGIAIDDVTLAEIRSIHEQCMAIAGPL